MKAVASYLFRATARILYLVVVAAVAASSSRSSSSTCSGDICVGIDNTLVVVAVVAVVVLFQYISYEVRSVV